MRKEIIELISKWDEFRENCDGYDFDEDDINR